jgi:hypothetical protein
VTWSDSQYGIIVVPASASKGMRPMIQLIETRPYASGYNRQDQRLHEDLGDDARATRPQSGSHGHLAKPCSCAGENQHRDVSTRDQQDQQCHDLEQVELGHRLQSARGNAHEEERKRNDLVLESDTGFGQLR